ncbi:MAG TPA: RDD family protein [Cryptosporangiaceae bacterium]|nr:RDD family protein [Cryptosporangiaceae bacterium]
MSEETPSTVAGSDRHRGARFGLPPSGPGSAASFGRRLAALAVDAVLSVLVASLFTRPDAPRLWSAIVLFGVYAFFVGFFGQTPGMRLLGIACVRLADGRPLGLPRAALRALLLQALVPAVMLDPDGRGWHDRAAGSVVIRV